MRTKDVMRTSVVTATREMSLKDVANLLVEHRISGLPVCERDGSVVGVVSEADILFKEAQAPEEPSRLLAWLLDGRPSDELAKATARTAGEAMSSPPITVHPERPAAAAARLMLENGINRLPVVTSAGALVGIVTRADLVRAFARSDADVEQDIRESVIRRSLWLDPQAVQVTVRDGEVQLSGVLETSDDVALLERLVGEVPGVVSVGSSLAARGDDRPGRD